MIPRCIRGYIEAQQSITSANALGWTITPTKMSSKATILPILVSVPICSCLQPTFAIPSRFPSPLVTIRAALAVVANNTNALAPSVATPDVFTSALANSAVIHSAPPTATATAALKPDIKVGPIPLPAFIGLVFFGPFFLALIFWVAYRKTVYRWVSNRSAEGGVNEEANKGALGKVLTYQSTSRRVKSV